MVTLSNTETELVRQLIDCLARAMRQTEGVDVEYANKTKMQKLLYLAIEEFDVPVTYSWYLAGSVVESDTVAPNTLRTAFDELPSTDHPSGGAAAGTESARMETDSDPDADLEERSDSMPPVLFDASFGSVAPDDSEPSGELSHYVEPSEVVDFYTKVIPEVWFQSTMRFLQNFYLEHAPPEYRDLYVTSVQLRTNLTEFQDAVRAAVEGEDHHRSRSDIVHGIELQVSDLHLRLADVESLSATFDTVVESTDLLERALVSIAALKETELTGEHVDLVGELVDFFYYGIWRYPCLILSRETATGPSASDVETQRVDQLRTFESKLEARHEQLEERLDHFSLVEPRASESTLDDELVDRFAELSEEYLGPG